MSFITGSFIPQNFITDQQTLHDLNLLGKHRRGSVFSLFCKVHTKGGERLLEAYFRHPLTDADAISARSGLFRYFSERNLVFPLSGSQVEAMENYLESPGDGHLPASVWHGVRRKVMASLVRDEAAGLLREGLAAAVNGLQVLNAFLRSVVDGDGGGAYAEKAAAALKVLSDGRLKPLLDEDDPGKWSLVTAAKYDHLLRTKLRGPLELVRTTLSELDVYICVGNLARANGWCFATVAPFKDNVFMATGLRHPAIPNAVGNWLALHPAGNLCFLTGANMAGKSTYMKAVGIAVYLAHMGFPVAADKLAFSVKEGLFTSINVSDDISQGHSHFYAEVLRVKKVAQAVSEGRRLVVLFDELFKGTNVKDAYDGTLAVTEAFARYGRAAFIISTHIVEVGEALRKYANVRFAYLPSNLENGRPRYTYQLEEGIAADRVGMMIIENEGIIELIKK